jgi:sulfopyruvate decarboxylase alpha subunit
LGRLSVERKKMSSVTATDSWSTGVFELLRGVGVAQFCYVPDGGHKDLISEAVDDPSVRAIPLTTEEEGVALLAGADLGDERAVLLMQSSGVGNCVNMLSLLPAGGFPFLTIVTMRGDFGEQNPWQLAMGQAVQSVLEAMNVICLRVDRREDVLPTIDAASSMAYVAGRAVAVLIGQRVIGAKSFARE